MPSDHNQLNTSIYSAQTGSNFQDSVFIQKKWAIRLSLKPELLNHTVKDGVTY
jgi:uncharacterized protein YdcH (DUF465 family)